MGRFIEGVKSAFQYNWYYATIINVVLLVTYAFKDTNYTFFETAKYHFAFYYFFLLLPLFVATLIGKKLLYTEYPKLAYVVMPIITLLPYILLRPGRCMGISCDIVDLYVGLIVGSILAIRTAVHMYNDHGEYMEFSHVKKINSIRIVGSILLWLVVLGGIPALNSLHARNDQIILDLNTFSAKEIEAKCSQIMFNNEKQALCLLYAGTLVHDEGICKKIRRLITENEDADRCYQELATYTNEIKYCNNMVYDEGKFKCYYSFPLTDSLCEQIDDKNFQVNCFADCDKITDPMLKDSCLLNKADETKDMSFCNRISDPEEKEACQASLTSGADDCGKLDEDSAKDECYSNAAKEEGNVELCQNLLEQQGRDTCVLGVAVDPIECDAIGNENILEVCKAKLATTVEECEALTGIIALDSCYDSVAVALRDSTLCDKITDESKRAICTTRAAS